MENIHYLSSKTYKYLCDWKDAIRYLPDEKLETVLALIETDGSYILNWSKREALQNLLSTDEVSKDNLRYFTMSFQFIKSKGDLWREVEKPLKNGDFSKADSVFACHQNVLSSDEYLDLKNTYLEMSIMSEIESCFSDYKFEKANDLYNENNEFLNNDKYLRRKSEAIDRFVSEGWNKINSFLKMYSFSEADLEYKKYRSQIPLSEYKQKKNEVLKEKRSKNLSNLEDLLKESNFREAMDLVKTYGDKVVEKKFKTIKKEYLSALRTEKKAKLELYFSNHEFLKGVMFYNNSRSYISKGKYKNLIIKYQQVILQWIEKTINKYLYNNLTVDEIAEFQSILNHMSGYFDIKSLKDEEIIFSEIKTSICLFYIEEAQNDLLRLINSDKFFEYVSDFKKVLVESCKAYFVENYLENDYPIKIDTHQSLAAMSQANSILVSARAGSGKTKIIAGRIKYLLDMKNQSINSILTLSFNRDVSHEIKDRVNNGIKHKNKSVNFVVKYDSSYTFHKLAYKWTGNNKSILADQKKDFIRLIVNNFMRTNKQFEKDVYEFFKEESLTVEKKKFGRLEDYYIYIRNSKFRTLKGEYVKSKGEKWIADFLFEHDIEYYYEYTFYPSYIKDKNINGSPDFIQRCRRFLDKGTSRIKPDFYLKDYSIVWEHWGINENEANDERKKSFSQKFDTSWDCYYKSMLWKRDFWKKWRSRIGGENPAIKKIKEIDKLIETSVNDLMCKRDEFEQYLYKKLEMEGVILKRKTQEKLYKEVWKNANTYFIDLLESFINRYQQKLFNSRDHFLSQVEYNNSNKRLENFIKLGLLVLDEYENELKKEKKDLYISEYNQYTSDFNQLIVNAKKDVDCGKLDSEIEVINYILIDEYQDFSELFHQLITSILKRRSSIKLFCVGDDWQAINRFAGSDTDYFNNFTKYFPDSTIVNIPKNYRSNNRIIDKSNEFMKSNGMQGEIALANIEQFENAVFIKYFDNNKPIRHILKNYKLEKKIDEYLGKNRSGWFERNIYLKGCYKIINENPDKSILILHRKNDLNCGNTLQYFGNTLVEILKLTYPDNKNIWERLIDFKTIHKSKGLEADIVIILEVINGVIPMIHPDASLFSVFGESAYDSLNDEKRLFYVALTRAKEKVFLLTEKGNESDFIKNMTVLNESI